MTGGLIVLGFLFLTFIFRSAVVGDLAPVANRRGRAPRVDLPPDLAPKGLGPAVATVQGGFAQGRQRGRQAPPRLDAALQAMREAGVGDARILRVRSGWMRVRLYACGACGARGDGCEYARGFLVGALEAMTGEAAKAEETACRAAGADTCEFELRHAPRRVRP